jgi:hypothetical protein
MHDAITSNQRSNANRNYFFNILRWSLKLCALPHRKTIGNVLYLFAKPAASPLVVAEEMTLMMANGEKHEQ